MADATTKKKEIVSNWERIFGRKIETVINEAGLKWLWDTDTSVAEVIELLDTAAVNEAVGVVNSMFDHIFGDFEEDEPEQEEEAKPTYMQYRVIRVKGDEAHFVGSKDDVFDTYDEAECFRKQKAMSTALTLDDMKVLRVS